MNHTTESYTVLRLSYISSIDDIYEVQKRRTICYSGIKKNGRGSEEVNIISLGLTKRKGQLHIFAHVISF